MDKEDARFQKLEQLHERRRQVVRGTVSAADIAAKQLGGEIDIGIGEDVCLISNRKRTICCSSEGLQHCPHHDRLLGRR